jgi:CheY-like chemotaxis protein
VARQGSRVLVVDDNIDTARGLAKLLKLLGHDVRVAHDGPAALEAARAHRPEVILLDIGLPAMDGYEVVRRLRTEDCCKHSLIVAISGYGQDEDRSRSRAAGFDQHLVKPVDYDVLMSLFAEPGIGGRSS